MRRLLIITALLGALGMTAAAVAASGSSITEKVLGSRKHRSRTIVLTPETSVP